MQLPRSKRRLVFYSEGRNYWPNLGGLIRELLSKADIPICYISSDADDPGIHFKHDGYRSFVIDAGHIRNWLFENIDTDYLVMTMPDLHQFQVKRSRNPVHYIYVQHALMSLHMAYRHGAFDHYDTIFCAGPHHAAEIRALEKKYHLPPKTIFEHGYSRLDTLIESATTQPPPARPSLSNKRLLLAPTWGDQATIESGLAATLIDQLLEQGHQLTLRPHPQTIQLNQKRIDPILKKHRHHPNFVYEGNVISQQSLHESEMMISDWSGVALEYALGLAKPVLFVDTPKKVNNPHYQDIGLEPFEAAIRHRIGRVMEIQNGGVVVPQTLDTTLTIDDASDHVYNLGHADQAGADYLLQLLKAG